MDSDDALASDKDKLSLFKLLGSSTQKAGINATRELKVVDYSSSNGEPRTGIDDQAILQEQKDRNKAETSDVVSDLLGDSVRIKHLKAIVASNSRPAVAKSAPSLQPVPEPYKMTEDAALNLWNTLTALR
ncbi:hypothetical protein HOY80DRAFT_1052981 [Tuber brumale]|nr:hypothetical protein HOY80DRAFT_1052981 [Tuber brumale]